MNRIETVKAIGEVLTLKEACQYFRVSKITLINALQSGQLQGFRVGRQWRVYKYPPKEGLKYGAETETIVNASNAEN